MHGKALSNLDKELSNFIKRMYLFTKSPSPGCENVEQTDRNSVQIEQHVPPSAKGLSKIDEVG